VPLKRFVRLSADKAVELVDGYQAGAPVNELARQFGIHRETVSAHLRRAGVPRRYRILGEDAVADASRLYTDGWPLVRIAEHLDVSANTVHRALQKGGVPLAGLPWPGA